MTGVPTTYNFTSAASSAAGSYSASDAYLMIDGSTIIAGNAMPPVSMTADTLLYDETIVIEGTLANRGNSTTTGEIQYTEIASLNKPASVDAIISHYVNGNQVTVHTPVVCYVDVKDQLNDVQVLNPNGSATQLIIGETFDVHYPTDGQHLTIPGYGNRDYASTTKQRQAFFQFDVYEGSDDTGIIHQAGSWIDIHGDDTTFYIPNWARESAGTRLPLGRPMWEINIIRVIFNKHFIENRVQSRHLVYITQFLSILKETTLPKSRMSRFKNVNMVEFSDLQMASEMFIQLLRPQSFDILDQCLYGPSYSKQWGISEKIWGKKTKPKYLFTPI